MSDQPPRTLGPRTRLLLTIGVIALGLWRARLFLRQPVGICQRPDQ
jgi:hypothetical protein